MAPGALAGSPLTTPPGRAGLLFAAVLTALLASGRCGPPPGPANASRAQRVAVSAVQSIPAHPGTSGLRIAGFLRPAGPQAASGGVLSGTPGEIRSYRAELRLPPALLKKFRPGDRVEALLPARGVVRTIPGRVLEINERGLVAGLRFEARIIDHLLLEFFVYPGRSVPRFRVPLGAILNPTGDQAFLMRVVTASDGSERIFAERVPIVVIDRAPRDGQIGIIGPVAEGERVIVRGHANLLNGEEVIL